MTEEHKQKLNHFFVDEQAAEGLARPMAHGQAAARIAIARSHAIPVRSASDK